MFERLPCPFGLIRYGVAPDHPEIKSVINDFAAVAASDGFRFLGNVPIGQSVKHIDLSPYYSGLIYAYGASSDKSLNIPGESRIYSARSFVEWYNAMPGAASFDLSEVETLAIVGNGNVAIDVARLMAAPLHQLRTSEMPMEVYLAMENSGVKDVHVIGRRGAMQAACAIKELRLLTTMEGLSLRVFDRDMKESVETEAVSEEEISQLRAKKRLFELFNSLPRQPDPSARLRIHFHFLQSPIAMSDGSLQLQRNVLKGRPGAKEAVSTSERSDLKCDLVLRSVGYQCLRIDENLPFDAAKGVVLSTNGRVLPAPPTYAAGWCRSGPVGILDSTMRSAFVSPTQQTADSVEADCKAGIVKPVADEKVFHYPQAVSWKEWLKIDEFEAKRGKALGKIREKVATVEEMLKIAKSKT